MVERNERELVERQQQMQQQQLEAQQQQAQMEAQAKEADMQLRDQMNQRDNETKIVVATIAANAKAQEGDGIEEPVFSEEAKANLMEKMRQFDKRLQLDKERLAFDKQKADTDAAIKRQQLKHKSNTSK